jgi:hypothetical protein
MRRKPVLLVAVLFLLIGGFGICFPHGYPLVFNEALYWVLPSNHTAMETGGVRMMIHSLRRTDDQIDFFLVLEWIPMRSGEVVCAFPHPAAAIVPLYWDARGKPIASSQPEWITLSREFRAGISHLDQHSVRLHLPPTARFLGVALGNLRTNPTMIPPAGRTDRRSEREPE